MPQSSAPTMIVQYGCRDEDDEDYSKDGCRRRGSFLGGLTRTASNRSLKKLGKVVSETKSLLKGARNSHFSLYHDLEDEDDEEDDDSSYESLVEDYIAPSIHTNSEDGAMDSDDDDDDNASVCSKASVASALRKMGGKLRLPKRSSNHKRSSTKTKGSKDSIERDYYDHEDQHDSDSDDEDDDGDNVSVNSSASRSSIRRISSKISKALHVTGRKKNKNKKSNNDDVLDGFEFSDSEEEEEDADIELDFGRLPHPTVPRRGPSDVAPPSRSKRIDDDDDDDSSQRSDVSDLSIDDDNNGGDHHEIQRNPFRNNKKKNVKDRSSSSKQKKDFFNPREYSQNWSMNVTPEMLEHQNTHTAPRRRP